MYNDFICRMDWCVKPYSEANHHPVAAFNGDLSDSIIRLKANIGEVIFVDASASTDPDGDSLIYSWWIYEEAGTYAGKVSIDSALPKISCEKLSDSSPTFISLASSLSMTHLRSLARELSRSATRCETAASI